MSSADGAAHPLRVILEAAAGGQFPPSDGRVEVLAPGGDDTRAVVAMTGHAYVLADVDALDLVRRGADGVGGATAPDVLRWLAGPDGTIGSLDVVLVAPGTGGGPGLPRRDDLADHPRVRRALEHRSEVEVWADDHGVVVIGHGLVGRREVSVELLHPARGSAGHGRRLIRAGLAAVPAGQWCWAQVAPGNAASLRAFLACGFVPIGAEVLLGPP